MKLKVKLFADGASLKDIEKLNKNSFITGFTTNPTLMRKAGIKDYEFFCKEVLGIISDKPISFEVFTDNLDEMYEQAIKISSWGNNVYVKIPITNTKNETTFSIVKSLTEKQIKLNITAIMTDIQVQKILPALENSPGAYLSIFAGRIADTGVDPLPILKNTIELLKDYKNTELIWASPREVYNVIQANDIDCHIITATSDILAKLDLFEKDLDEYSLETVKMFYNDALSAGYKI